MLKIINDIKRKAFHRNVALQFQQGIHNYNVLGRLCRLVL